MDPLADVFDLSRVSGAVLAQLIAYEPWGVAVDPLPGAVFHAVVAGSCWLRMPGYAPRRLMPGDVVLLPTNTPHALVSSVDARTESLSQFDKDARRTPDGDIVIPGPGAGTRVLCAAYDYDHEVAHPLMSQLPPLLYVPAGMPDADRGVADTLRLLALELGGRPPGSRAAVGRLIDVMLIHVMRAWLRRQDDAPDGWLLALRDPVLAAAMNAIHQRPAEPWTTETLAGEVSVSRATLARRFVQLVGQTPPEYLTRWRMDLAAQRLRDTEDTIAAIAAAVGYRSEYSFSRAFSRHRGTAPGRYRRHARARRLHSDDQGSRKSA
ncbi:MAG TPA: AraC family transcriptional regulator [Solirubrobacteraceae bacterium]